ncbi:WD repeat-containing protein 73-like isoform X2 [Hippocampus comes]|uniref:WD repeat-containing protein 73-like isoform X2 n=1 Tax=Hippocampus comes TaxID=109280 RepID=UPI00094E5A0F|nr:PREDICTED: WD repeat-containing protein 73-like isoform X2 [Hippocampus comes]
MEDSEFDELIDDWFIESLKTYRDLYVYQLEFPTRVIEWTSGKTICVAGYNKSSKNEILELCLPQKLFAEEKKGLCAERDFKVLHGGFSPDPVSVLKHVPGTRLIVTNDGLTSDLQVWNLGGDDSDVITKVSSVQGSAGSPGGVKMAARISPQPEVLHGCRGGDVRLTQLTTGQTLYQLASACEERLTSLHFVSNAVFLAACANGDVLTVDTRTSSPPQLAPAPSMPDSDVWWADVSGRGGLIRVSSSGWAAVSDPRGPTGITRRARLAVGTPHRDSRDVNVLWAPALDDIVAVSGFSGAVQIYDTSSWQSEPRDSHPLFEHRGHAVCSQRREGGAVAVNCHLWHPKETRTLVSAAADASLHVWDWIHPSDAR